jgi:hypothetical protein
MITPIAHLYNIGNNDIILHECLLVLIQGIDISEQLPNVMRSVPYFKILMCQNVYRI